VSLKAGPMSRDSPLRATKNGVLVLAGYGLKVVVERGHLVVEDGICDERRSARFAKATAGLKRVVVLGHTGFVTLQALRFLKDLAAAFINIDADGQLVAAFGPQGKDETRLRRVQAQAMTHPIGLAIAKWLIREKLTGQGALLDALCGRPEACAVVRGALEAVARARSLDAVLLAEASAAAATWTAWADTSVSFPRRDAGRVPEHWLHFGQRTSPLTGSPRLAANPANAMLNYLYALLEAEARVACLAVGLDPGIGILHADQPARDSLALDIMEAVRPQVDAYLLELLRKRTFRMTDFFENRQGVCRVLPPLTHALAETAPFWAKRVAPVAERVVRMLLAAPGMRISRIPTPLTQSNRSAARDAIRRRPKRIAVSKQPLPPAVCRSCGVVLDASDRAFCDDCLPEHQEAFQRAGPIALRRLRAGGRDPAHGGEAGRKRGTSNARRQREVRSWNRAHPVRPDPEVFRREILPRLQEVSLGRIAKATGLTRMYCSWIRRGFTCHTRNIGKHLDTSAFANSTTSNDHGDEKPELPTTLCQSRVLPGLTAWGAHRPLRPEGNSR